MFSSDISIEEVRRQSSLGFWQGYHQSRGLNSYFPSPGCGHNWFLTLDCMLCVFTDTRRKCNGRLI